MGAASYAAYRKAGSPSIQNLLSPPGVIPTQKSIYAKPETNLKNSMTFLNPNDYMPTQGIKNDRAFMPKMQRDQLVTMRNNTQQADWPANQSNYLEAYADKDYNTRGPGGTYILREIKDPYLNGNQKQFTGIVQRRVIENFNPSTQPYDNQVVLGQRHIFESHQENDSFNPEVGIYQYTVKRGKRIRRIEQ